MCVCSGVLCTCGVLWCYAYPCASLQSANPCAGEKLPQEVTYAHARCGCLLAALGTSRPSAVVPRLVACSGEEALTSAGTAGKLLAVPNLILSASLSTPRCLAPLTSFHLSFMLLGKRRRLFLKLLCNSPVPTAQVSPSVAVSQLWSDLQAGCGWGCGDPLPCSPGQSQS